MRYFVKRAGIKLCRAVGLIEVSKLRQELTKMGLGLIMAGALLAQFTVHAEAKELSEQSVKVLMDRAWEILPSKFTFPNGKVITINKKKREVIAIPLGVARHVIQVARLSGLSLDQEHHPQSL